jgi:hypothetical protein
VKVKHKTLQKVLITSWKKSVRTKYRLWVNYVTERVTPLRLHRSRQRARLRRGDYGVCPSGVNISARDGGEGTHTGWYRLTTVGRGSDMLTFPFLYCPFRLFMGLNQNVLFQFIQVKYSTLATYPQNV